MQMGELSGRLKQEETKVSAERAQHNAASKDLMLAQEEVLELKRRVRVAVRFPGLCSAYLACRHMILNTSRQRLSRSAHLHAKLAFTLNTRSQTSYCACLFRPPDHSMATFPQYLLLGTLQQSYWLLARLGVPGTKKTASFTCTTM